MLATLLRSTAVVLLGLLLVAAAPTPSPVPSIEVPAFVTALDDAARGLMDDPVYVAEGAEPTLTEDERDQLRERLEDVALGESEVFVALLAADYRELSRSTMGGLPSEVIARTGRPGIIVVVEGTEAAYGQTPTSAYPEGTAAAAGEAIGGPQIQGDLATALTSFVDEVAARAGTAAAEEPTAEAASEQAAAPAQSAAPAEEPEAGSELVWLVVGLVLAAAAGALWLRSRRGSGGGGTRAPRGKVEGVRLATREDLQALRRAIAGLGEAPEGDAAVARKAAQAAETTAAQAIDAAERPEDFRAITQTLREGAEAVIRARAATQGRPVPESATLCVFDPRHGPSAREVLWTPQGASARRVPACARDAARVEAGQAVPPRTVEAGGVVRPFWDAAEYGPWAEGWYGTAAREYFTGMRIGTR